MFSMETESRIPNLPFPVCCALPHCVVWLNSAVGASDPSTVVGGFHPTGTGTSVRDHPGDPDINFAPSVTFPFVSPTICKEYSPCPPPGTTGRLPISVFPGRTDGRRNVAAEFDVDPGNLDRLFRQRQGMTVSVFVSHQRKKYVIERLQDGRAFGEMGPSWGSRKRLVVYRWVKRAFGVPFAQLRRSFQFCQKDSRSRRGTLTELADLKASVGNCVLDGFLVRRNATK